MRSSKTALYTTVAAVAALSAVTAFGADAASKPKVPACATWTDPAGDGSVDESGVGSDSALDITKVTLRSTGKKLTGEISVPGFAQRPMVGTGNRYQVQLTIAGHPTYFYYNDSSTRAQQENAFYQSGVYVDGARVKGSETLVSEVAGAGKVSLSISLADLASAVGTKITPTTKVVGGEANSFATMPGLKLAHDTATAPATTKFGFGVCK